MKDIKNYEGLYQVSETGDVYSVRSDKLLSPACIRSGAASVTLSKDGKGEKKLVHRLVAEAYMPNPEGKPQVDHIDGNKQNNNVSNLRWCTNEENQAFRDVQGNSGKENISKGIRYGDKMFDSIKALSRHIAAVRGSKMETIRKELKAVKYGGKTLYGEWCELV